MSGRRPLLAGILAVPAAGMAAAPLAARAAAGAAARAADRLIGTIRRQLDAIAAGPALLASYPDRTANAAFAQFAPANDPAAYTYDNALAGLALLAGGHGLGAGRIADALVLAQAHDPTYRDGRLRNAYRAGAVAAPVALPGWWDERANLWAEDPYQVGSEAGPIAWAILLWTALRDAGVNSERYDAAARRAAGWITDRCRGARGYTGGVFGFPPHPLKLTWVSTEQNTDLAVAFGRLGRKTEAGHAAAFVRSMQDAGTRLFDAGLTPAGAPNRLIAADANFWPYLAGLADDAVIAPAITALGWPRARPGGVGFSAASRGLWTEGTCFAALALRRAGQSGLSRQFMAIVETQEAPDGSLFTGPDRTLATGLTIGPGPGAKVFEYYRVPALAPTAWAILAGLGVNPLA